MRLIDADEVDKQRRDLMEQLKPCPFCGNAPVLLEKASGTCKYDDGFDFYKDYKLWCCQCGCEQGRNIIIRFKYSPHVGVTVDEAGLEKAIESWNRRANDEAND